jgi:hypothetical protein
MPPLVGVPGRRGVRRPDGTFAEALFAVPPSGAGPPAAADDHHGSTRPRSSSGRGRPGHSDLCPPADSRTGGLRAGTEDPAPAHAVGGLRSCRGMSVRGRRGPRCVFMQPASPAGLGVAINEASFKRARSRTPGLRLALAQATAYPWCVKAVRLDQLCRM